MFICPSGSKIINTESCFLFPWEINMTTSGSQIDLINNLSITECLASQRSGPWVFLCCLSRAGNIFICFVQWHKYIHPGFAGQNMMEFICIEQVNKSRAEVVPLLQTLFLFFLSCCFVSFFLVAFLSLLSLTSNMMDAFIFYH